MSEKKINLAEVVYILYFAVMFGAKACGLYEGRLLYNVSIVAGMLLLGMCLLVYRNTGEKGFLIYMTMMLGMKGVSLPRIEKVGAAIGVACFSALTFLSVTGIIDGKTTLSANRGGADVMLRHYLGYPNCNVTHTAFVIVVMLIVLVRGYRGKKYLLLTSIFLYVLNIYVYVYTMSNTGLIAATMFVVALFYLYRKETIGKIDGVLIGLLYPLCMFISIGLPMIIEGDLFWKLDSILHNRMNYPHYWLTHEPITLFGVRFGEASNTDYYIDSSFLYSFLQLGVVPCIILTAMMLGMIYNLIKQNRKTEVAIFVALCVLGLSDPFFYNLAYKNIMFLFIGDMFYGWIGSVEKRLPAVFGRKIRIISVGAKEIEYGKSVLYRIWTRCWECLDNIISIRGTRNLLLFIALSVILYLVSFYVISPESVTGAVDTLEEWEYVRKMLSVGVWVSGLVVLVMTGRATIKKESVGESL